jgi:hypothetical protein
VAASEAPVASQKISQNKQPNKKQSHDSIASKINPYTHSILSFFLWAINDRCRAKQTKE